ncbi:MAG: AAA family ATPase [Deltaproteobacteria bacterium]|nr:AAA family ATPase [Deltaproteobacteria bacterium]
MNWTLQELEPEIDQIRARINQHRRMLNEFFVNRQDEIDLAVTCAAAQEPVLFVGLPGTAKSDLVVKFVESLGLGQEDYFEYMLTKFTEPSEILGPIDIDLLKQGRFMRRTKGKLPEAKVAFLDEIFKSNSAILNTLLTIVNERKFYQDGEPTPVGLRMLFAATNEIPEQSELDALADRFVVKVETRPVKDTHFTELIDAGLMNEVYRATGQRPWVRGVVSFEDYLKFKRYMDLSFGVGGNGAADREAWFPAPVFAEMRRIVRTLETEDKIFVSDRKLVKLYKVIRSRAFLFHGGAVQTPDLILLAYSGNRRHELPAVQEKVHALLGLSTASSE